jgi:hypothetical protein
MGPQQWPIQRRGSWGNSDPYNIGYRDGMTQGSYDVRRGSNYDDHKDLYKSVDDGYTGDDKGAYQPRFREGYV